MTKFVRKENRARCKRTQAQSKLLFCLWLVMRDIKRYVNASRMIQNSMKGEITGTSRVGERG